VPARGQPMSLSEWGSRLTRTSWTSSTRRRQNRVPSTGAMRRGQWHPPQRGEVRQRGEINVTQVRFKAPLSDPGDVSQSFDCYCADLGGDTAHQGRQGRPLAVSTVKRTASCRTYRPPAKRVSKAPCAAVVRTLGPGWHPGGIVNKISADTRTALKDPAVREPARRLGNDTNGHVPGGIQEIRAERVQELRARGQDGPYQAAVMPRPVARTQ